MNLETMQDHDNRDVPRIRVLELLGNKILFKYTDPYGFISVNFEKGQMPKQLKDAMFTSYDEALKAVTNYLNEKGRPTKKEAGL